VIIFFAALISVLYYLGIMPLVIRWIGGALEKITGVSRLESLCAASNIFLGQSEAPLVIKPYLASLKPSQLFCVMSVGMAGVAGTILAAYAGLGIRIDYLVAASFMSAPGGICMAKLLMPDPKEQTLEVEDAILPLPGEGETEKPANLIMAASEGAQTGVRLAVAVGAMVLAFVALVALANGIMGWIGSFFGHGDLSFQMLLGYVFAGIFYLLGAPPGPRRCMRAACSAPRSCSTNSSPSSNWARRKTSRSRPSRWSPLRSAVSPISPPSPSRWPSRAALPPTSAR
jgi:CNT family concentrative nucleoside transporter